jgi:hypothetical protein
MPPLVRKSQVWHELRVTFADQHLLRVPISVAPRQATACAAFVVSDHRAVEVAEAVDLRGAGEAGVDIPPAGNR